jgi:integrase
LKKIFKRLVNEDVLRTNPAQTVKLLKENDADFYVLSDDEEIRYLLTAPQPLQDVAILMLETGMRCGEVYRIKRGEVFLDKGFLKVTKGKTKASIRQVHLSEKAKTVLRYRLLKFKGENLFPQNDEDFRAATNTLDKMHIRTMERVKMNFRLYDCRHTFASRAVENGVDLLTLSQILGHSGLKTISRYAHPSESYKADAIKKMENRKFAKAV